MGAPPRAALCAGDSQGVVMAEGRNQFTVDLGELELTDEDEQRIAESIQRAVLSEIARIDRGPRVLIDFLPDFGRTKGLLVRREGG